LAGIPGREKDFEYSLSISFKYAEIEGRRRQFWHHHQACFYASNSRQQFCSTTEFIYHSIVGMFGFRKLFVIRNAGSRCLACLLRLVNHRNGLKCFYGMSILVATVMLLLGFDVIDHLKTLMGTSPEQNCKEVI
jgi:hypothetical protein